MSGFYLMHRGWQDSPVFDREEFSRRDAWVWLIENATWKPSRARVKGEMIDLERGQLCFAQRFLAEKWGWSKSRVDRFLKLIADEGMIEVRSKNGATADHAAGQGQSIITICNYEKYQAPESSEWGNDEQSTGATAGQQRGNSGPKKKEGKEIKENTPLPPAIEDRTVSFWNSESSGTPLPQTRTLNGQRAKHLKARISEHGEDAVFQAIRNMCASDFHSGRDGKWTEGNLGWLLKSPENFQKMLERQAPARSAKPVDPGVYDRLKAKGFDYSASIASGPVPRSESTGPPRPISQLIPKFGSM